MSRKDVQESAVSRLKGVVQVSKVSIICDVEKIQKEVEWRVKEKKKGSILDGLESSLPSIILETNLCRC